MAASHVQVDHVSNDPTGAVTLVGCTVGNLIAVYAMAYSETDSQGTYTITPTGATLVDDINNAAQAYGAPGTGWMSSYLGAFEATATTVVITPSGLTPTNPTYNTLWVEEIDLAGATMGTPVAFTVTTATNTNSALSGGNGTYVGGAAFPAVGIQHRFDHCSVGVTGLVTAGGGGTVLWESLNTSGSYDEYMPFSVDYSAANQAGTVGNDVDLGLQDMSIMFAELAIPLTTPPAEPTVGPSFPVRSRRVIARQLPYQITSQMFERDL